MQRPEIAVFIFAEKHHKNHLSTKTGAVGVQDCKF